MKKKVALVINFYNPDAKYFIKSINSILNQTYKNFFLFLIDNNSKISLKKQLKKIFKKKKFKNFKFYKTESTLPLVKARNFAVHKVFSQKKKFDYLQFCDSDDWWEKKWLYYMLKYSNNGDLIFSNGYIHYKKNLIKKKICDCSPNLLIKECSIYFASMLISIKYLLKNYKKKKIFDERFEISYDYDFILSNQKKLKFIKVNKFLFHYNKMLDSLSSKNLIKIILEWEKIRKKNRINKIWLFHRKSIGRVIMSIFNK